MLIRLAVLRKPNREKGAAIVEYALLLALIAVVCIVAITTLDGKASSKFQPVGEPTTTAVASNIQSSPTAGDTSDQQTLGTSTVPTPALDCAEIYLAKALDSLALAETAHQVGGQQSNSDHLFARAQAYLAFAQAVHGQLPVFCPPQPKG